MGEDQEHLIHVTEAAKLLNVTTKTIFNMTKKGVLTGQYEKGPNGRKMLMFREGSVALLGELLAKGIDFNGTVSIAMQALAVAKSNERRLNEVFRFLGLDRPNLSVKEEDIVSMYARVQEGMESTDYADDEEVIREWASTIYAIDEAYLDLVQKYVGTDEPWLNFINLAHHVYRNAPLAAIRLHPPLRDAYVYMRVARDNLRTVSYHYCRQRMGISPAAERFMKGDRVPLNEIAALIFPTPVEG